MIKIKRDIKFLLIGLMFLGCKIQKGEDDMPHERCNFIFLAKKFKNISLFRTSSQGIVINSYYKNSKNTYVFKIEEKIFKLENEIIQFSPDSILNIDKNKLLNSDYSLILSEKAKYFCSLLDSCGVFEISAEFQEFGIDSKMYLKSGGVYLYVEEISNLTSPEWKKYLDSSEKIYETLYFNKN